MLRFARPIAFLLPIIAAVDSAHASCFPPTPFSQVATGNYHYFFLPDGSLATSDSLVGRFWKAGSPAVNEGTCDESVWLQRCGADCTVQSTGPVFYVHGVMGAMPCTSSCFDGEMNLLIEDRNSSGQFLVARVDESPGPIFDFSRLGDLRAVAIPRPVIQSYTHPTSGSWIANLRIDDPAQGFYGLPGVPATGTITGLQILRWRGSTPPPEREPWTLLARVPYVGGQTTAQVEVGDPCPPNDPRPLYLAVALELDGQILTHYVSARREMSTCVPERWFGGGHLPESGSGALQVSRSPGVVTLSWGASCVSTNGFAVYAGVLGEWTSHVPLSCNPSGLTETYTEPAGNAYFLVVPTSVNLIPPDVEGSYGLLRDGSERPRSSQACFTEQAIVTCP